MVNTVSFWDVVITQGVSLLIIWNKKRNFYSLKILPDNIYRVLRNDSIACNDAQIMFHCLWNYNSVKRVFMNLGQRFNSFYFLWKDRNYFDASLLADFLNIRNCWVDCKLSKRLFNCNFPEWGYAYVQFFFFGYNLAGSFCKLSRIAKTVNKGICIKNVFYIYSLKQSGVSSKSGAI